VSNLEKAGRLLRLMGWISLLVVIGIIAAVAIPALSEGSGSEGLSGLIFLAILALAIPILYLKTASAIKQGKKWGKVTGAVIATISLLNLPIGTIFGAAILFYLKKGWGEVKVGNYPPLFISATRDKVSTQLRQLADRGTDVKTDIRPQVRSQSADASKTKAGLMNAELDLAKTVGDSERTESSGSEGQVTDTDTIEYTSTSKTPAPSDQEYYLTATKETESEGRNEALWAKSMALCEGNEEKAKYKYIRLRVEQLNGRHPS
jgi:hypothetical protein